MPSTQSRNLTEECRSKYGSSESFLAMFNPERQYIYCLYKDRCFCGSAPSLSVVSKCYGSNVSELFVSAQIKDLMEYTGNKGKLTIHQIDALSKVIVSTFYYLKVTELMYFFFLFKSGRFGSFYGSVDTIVITQSIREFLKIRNDEIESIERKRNQEEAERRNKDCAKNAISYEEWVSIRDKYK